MKILAHRGYWNKSKDCNTLDAIKKALDSGYGFESDVRDFNGRLVISHDPADAFCPSAESVFEQLACHHDDYCFAINIKADGLKLQIKNMIEKYNISNYFLFDMSIPQMVEFEEIGLKFYTRQSEIEKEPCMYEKSVGVWIDSFWSDSWITKDLLSNHIRKKKGICVVSPELHGRKDYKKLWKIIKDYDNVPNFFLCTDYPDEAKEYFYE